MASPVLNRWPFSAKLDPRTQPPDTHSCSTAPAPEHSSDHRHIPELHGPELLLASEEEWEEEEEEHVGVPAALEEFKATCKDAETITGNVDAYIITQGCSQ